MSDGRRSPFQMAMDRFWAKRSVRWLAGIFLAMLLAGIYAPFLVGPVALLWWDDTGLHFPVIAELFNYNVVQQRHDLLFNIIALFLPVAVLVWLLGRRRGLGWRPVAAGLIVAVVVTWSVVQIPLFAPLAEGGDRRSVWDRRSKTTLNVQRYRHLAELQSQGTAALRSKDIVRDGDDGLWEVRYADHEAGVLSVRPYAGDRTAVQELAIAAVEPVLPWLTILPLVPHDYAEPYEGVILKGLGTVNPATGSRFWLGTDQVGRDVLAMMIYGIRISFTIGVLATGISLSIGIIVGAVSAFFGGWVDLILQRVVEIVMTLPTFIVTLIVISVFGKNIFLIIVVWGVLGWAGTARLIRGEFLSQVEREYVLACRSMGLSKARIMFRHILPNTLTPLLVAVPFSIAGAVLGESGLACLGLVESDTPSWGIILNNGRDKIEYPHLIYAPGLAIFVLVYGLNLLGNSLREALDPKGTA